MTRIPSSHQPRISIRQTIGLVLFALMASSTALFGQLAGTNPLVRFHTDLGDMDVLLLMDLAPHNVSNFLSYVTPGKYDNSFVHRAPPMFVVQGGGFKYVNGTVTQIAPGPTVGGEFQVSNTRGTLAMALGSFQNGTTNPDSATSQWFFNESDSNAASLDPQKFTVFGRIVNSIGLTTLNAIAAVPVFDADGPNAHQFDDLPLRNYDTVNNPPIADANLVHVIWIKVVPQIVAITRTNATTVHVQGRGAASTTYKLQMSSTPDASGFTTSVNVSTGTGGNLSYDDTSAGTKKFYRLAIP
jgi:peptidyl-prolyl cis-trans isomerase A (cyclophilin A)